MNEQQIRSFLDSLTSTQKEDIVAALLPELTWPLRQSIFRAQMALMVFVPVDLLLFNDSDQLLLIPRPPDAEDAPALHIPGTVYRDTDTINSALQRILAEDIGTETTQPIPYPGWVEVLRGTGIGQNPFRHEISLPHYCKLIGNYMGTGVFVNPDNLPEELVPSQKLFIPRIIAKLRKAGIIK